MSKDKSNNNSNLVKSTTNDQIETENDNVELSPISKKEQFLNLFGVKIGEEFYIKSEQESNKNYIIYHFSEQLSLLGRSSNDKEGMMNWCSPSIGKLLEDDVELIKL